MKFPGVPVGRYNMFWAGKIRKFSEMIGFSLLGFVDYLLINFLKEAYKEHHVAITDLN